MYGNFWIIVWSKSLIYIFKSILYIHYHVITWGTSSIPAALTDLIELQVLKLLKIFTALAFRRFK